MGFTSDRPLLTAKQYEVLYAKLIERRPRDRQENDTQYQVHVKFDAMSIADELAEAEKQRKKSRKRETARLLKIQEHAALAEALACPTQRTKKPIDFYTSDGLPNVSPEMQSAYLDDALRVEKGVVASKSPPLAKNPKKKKKLPALQAWLDNTNCGPQIRTTATLKLSGVCFGTIFLSFVYNGVRIHPARHGVCNDVRRLLRSEQEKQPGHTWPGRGEYFFCRRGWFSDIINNILL